jgi:Dullard-like phosphatase family protein
MNKINYNIKNKMTTTLNQSNGGDMTDYKKQQEELN